MGDIKNLKSGNRIEIDVKGIDSLSKFKMIIINNSDIDIQVQEGINYDLMGLIKEIILVLDIEEMEND